MIDESLLDRRFSVVQTADVGAGIVQAFESSGVRYCVIGDRWTPGGHGLLLNRHRFIGDLVDIGLEDPKWRHYWQWLLTRSPQLLSTFIAGPLLGELPFELRTTTTPVDLGAPIERQVNEYLADYLHSWPRQQELRAEVVDFKTANASELRSNAIAVANAQVVGVFDPQSLDYSRLLRTRRSMPLEWPPEEGPTSRSPPVAPASVAEGTVADKPFIAHPLLSVKGPVQRGAELPFVIGLSDRPDADADEQRPIDIEKPTPGDTILVIATAEGATIEEPSYVELPLDLAARHEFKARVAANAERLRLRASYLYRHKPVGHIVKSVPLDASAVTAIAGPQAETVRFAPGPPRRLTRHEEVADLDLVLYVEKGEPGCVSWRAYVPATRRHHGPHAVKLDDTEKFARDLAGLRGKYGDASAGAAEELRVIGQQIAKCIPTEIVADALVPALTGEQPPTILIQTDEAFVPWELARFGPRVLGRGSPAFLGEIACIGRWWTAASLGGPPSTRSIQHLSAVAATEYTGGNFATLAHAKAERELLATTYRARAVEARQPDVDHWLDTEPRPTGHLGHIALHGFSDLIADAQGLVMGDGEVLTPNRLAGEYYEGDTPRFEILFLNACQVGTAGERLGRIAGFPGAVLGAGTAAFIGPLWEVEDSVAQAVAECFYRCVLNQKEEIGEALRQLRSSTTWRGSITPWAYLFYGHPRLQLTLASGVSHVEND